MGRLRKAELVDEDLRELGVVVLPRVDDDVLGVRKAPLQRRDDRGHLDEVRPRSDDVEKSSRAYRIGWSPRPTIVSKNPLIYSGCRKGGPGWGGSWSKIRAMSRLWMSRVKIHPGRPSQQVVTNRAGTRAAARAGAPPGERNTRRP